MLTVMHKLPTKMPTKSGKTLSIVYNNEEVVCLPSNGMQNITSCNKFYIIFGLLNSTKMKDTFEMKVRENWSVSYSKKIRVRAGSEG